MTAFVIAMDSEAAALTANLGGAVESVEYGRRTVRGTLNGVRTMVVISGIGKANAAAATQFAIQSGARHIVNTGVCGGIEPGMAPGELYEVSAAVEYDFDLAKINGTAVGVLNERSSPYIAMSVSGNLPSKILATGDHFNDGDGDLPLLVALKAGLRDMEGAAVAHVCETAGIACSALKCVTNIVGASGTAQYAANLSSCIAILTRYFAHFRPPC